MIVIYRWYFLYEANWNSFQIRLAELREYNKSVGELLIDFELMLEMAKLSPKEGSRRYEALYTANDMVGFFLLYIFFALIKIIQGNIYLLQDYLLIAC